MLLSTMMSYRCHWHWEKPESSPKGWQYTAEMRTKLRFRPIQTKSTSGAQDLISHFSKGSLECFLHVPGEPGDQGHCPLWAACCPSCCCQHCCCCCCCCCCCGALLQPWPSRSPELQQSTTNCSINNARAKQEHTPGGLLGPSCSPADQDTPPGFTAPARPSSGPCLSCCSGGGAVLLLLPCSAASLQPRLCPRPTLPTPQHILRECREHSGGEHHRAGGEWQLQILEQCRAQAGLLHSSCMPSRAGYLKSRERGTQSPPQY
jgi:hypothetical protein